VGIVLFLCTGNYYRSRFAEILFNALAAERGLAWRAESGRLALERGVDNVGPLSAAVAERLAELRISTAGYQRLPRSVTAADFQRATLIVALKEAEHRPLLQARHPHWAERVEYWHVHDLDFAPVEQALAAIQQRVRELIARLDGG
jgi:protein-tyrosine phosphatase